MENDSASSLEARTFPEFQAGSEADPMLMTRADGQSWHSMGPWVINGIPTALAPSLLGFRMFSLSFHP